MSDIHFIGGEKGGVGKSVFSRALSQYFLDNSEQFTAFDADQSHATLTRFYQDYSQPLIIDQFEKIDEIIELANGSQQNILIDLPSQSQRFLDQWVEENGVLDLCHELGISLNYWYVVDDSQDSVKLLSEFIQKYNHSIKLVVVKNHGRGSDFNDIDTLTHHASHAQSLNISTLDLPKLYPSTMHKIDKLNFSFWAAANLKDQHPHLNLMERQRARVWIEKTSKHISNILQNRSTNYPLNETVVPFQQNTY